jgi:2-methylcitrate dehydratase PrpD
VDAAYPAQWIGKVRVETHDGRTLHGKVLEPKGDPGNTLSRAELEDKALRLALYQQAASEVEMRSVIQRIWDLPKTEVVSAFFPLAS